MIFSDLHKDTYSVSKDPCNYIVLPLPKTIHADAVLRRTTTGKRNKKHFQDVVVYALIIEA